MRRTATWLLVAAVGAVAVLGVVDAVRRSSSHADSARGNVVRIDGLTMTAPLAQVTTEGAATTAAVAATRPAGTTAPSVVPAQPERWPPCDTEQMRLALIVEEDSAAAVLRRVKGEPCHHGRASIGFAVRDQSGDRVAVFGGNTRTTQPADFSNGFEELIDIPSLSCDPAESVLVVVTVGPYMARRTVPGKKLPCNHG
jgi:hypothetical protein